MNYKNKKVLVYGLGASGRSVIKILQKIGADVYVFDERKRNPEKRDGRAVR